VFSVCFSQRENFSDFLRASTAKNGNAMEETLSHWSFWSITFNWSRICHTILL